MMVVKRAGGNQPFDERKVYASVYAASQRLGNGEQDAEQLAETVADDVRGWMREKKQVNSQDLFERIAAELERHDAAVAEAYRTGVDA